MFCRQFLYKKCCVLQALYKTCVLQALSPQNMLCPARLFSTKYFVFCRHSISKHVFYRHFLHKTCCVLHVFSLQNMFCSGGTLSQNMYSTGTFSTKHFVSSTSFLYKTCVLQALYLKNVFYRHFLHQTCCVLHVFSLQNMLCSAGTLSQNMCSTGTFSTKHVVSCTSFLYKICCVLQALYLKTCILQALSPQNMLCPARLFSTKHVLWRFSISKMCSTGTFSTKHVVSCRSFLSKTCCVPQALYLQNMCSTGTFFTKHVVSCRPFLYNTFCVLQALSLQNKLCSADIRPHHRHTFVNLCIYRGNVYVTVRTQIVHFTSTSLCRPE